MFGASAESIPDRLLGCYYSVPKWEKQYIVAVGWHYLIHPATADAGDHVRFSPAAAAVHRGARWRPLRSRGVRATRRCRSSRRPMAAFRGCTRGVPLQSLSCLSWKWRKRSSVKIAERTYEKGTKALHRRGEGSHFEAAPFGQGSGLGLV